MGNTLLNYDLRTDQFPLQASPSTGPLNTRTLELVVSNPNPGKPVKLRGLTITLKVGDAASDLMPDASNPTPFPPSGWTKPEKSKGAGMLQYVFRPEAGGGVVGKSGLSFRLLGVAVNREPGTTAITVREGSADEPQNDPTYTILLTKFMPDWGDVAFYSEDDIVAYEGSTVLHWSGPAGAGADTVTYEIDYYDYARGKIINVPDDGDPPLGNSGQYPAGGAAPLVLTHDPTVFNLHVSASIGGQNYAARKSVVVTVEPPPPKIDSFYITAEMPKPGARPAFTLQWKVSHATFEITADDGEDGQSRSLDIPQSYTSFTLKPDRLKTVYTLTAYPKGEEFKTMSTDKPGDAQNPTQQVTAVINQVAMPVGSIINYAGVEDPKPLEVEGAAQWMLCDGRALCNSDYPELHKLIGSYFGNGSENPPPGCPGESFNIPDLRGRFVRGADTTNQPANRDPDVRARTAMRAGGNTGQSPQKIGSLQGDALQDHAHGFSLQTSRDFDHTGSGYVAGINSSKGSLYESAYSTPNPVGSAASAGARGVQLSSETRPVNAYLNFLIRVK